MNIRIIYIITISFLACAGCDRHPAKLPLAQAAETTPTVEAVPFRGEVYRAFDASTVLTLVSRDECELQANRTTLLCKYTKQPGALRVVTTASGTNQVLYYRFVDQGLQDIDGNVLLSPDRYATAMDQKRLSNQAAALERERVAQVKANAQRETQTIGTFVLSPIQYANGIGPDRLELTNVSVKLHHPANKVDFEAPPKESVILFSRVRGLVLVKNSFSGKPVFMISHSQERLTYVNEEIACKSEADAERIYNAVNAAFDSWKTKFPEAVLQLN